MVSDFKSALLERKHNVGQQFATGWLFGTVVNYEDAPMVFDRYDSLAAGVGLASIAGGTPNFWWEWQNVQNQSIFREANSDKILQAFIGIYPPRLRLFKQFPMPINRGNLYEIKVPAALTVTSPGFITGEWSPYMNPTTLAEIIVPPELQIGWGVFNAESFAVNPRFMIIIRRLQIKYFDPDTKNGMKNIEAITKGKVPAKLWSPGLEPFEYDVASNIGIETYEWTPNVIVSGG